MHQFYSWENAAMFNKFLLVPAILSIAGMLMAADSAFAQRGGHGGGGHGGWHGGGGHGGGHRGTSTSFKGDVSVCPVRENSKNQLVRA
jgi:hypothetical protein